MESNPVLLHRAIKSISAVFITFSGNCRNALTFYQSCFGGTLQFEALEMELQGHLKMPVVSGSLVSDRITIHGSDLVHDEGRRLGNHISVFLHCTNADERKLLMEKLLSDEGGRFESDNGGQKLVEVTDAFDVRWVLGV